MLTLIICALVAIALVVSVRRDTPHLIHVQSVPPSPQYSIYPFPAYDRYWKKVVHNISMPRRIVGSEKYFSICNSAYFIRNYSPFGRHTRFGVLMGTLHGKRIYLRKATHV